MSVVIIVARKSYELFLEKLKTLELLKSNITSAEDAALFAQKVRSMHIYLKSI